jgi:prevent-host-death family protein
MERIAVYDARAKFSELIERAAEGEEVVITRRGKPIVRLVAAGQKRESLARRGAALVRRIERLRKKLNIRGVNIRKIIEAGRR